jgi:hypothetical protein
LDNQTRHYVKFILLFAAFWQAPGHRKGRPAAKEIMVSTILNLAAGLLSLVGLVSLVIAAMGRKATKGGPALWTARIGLTAAGLMLFLNAFLGGGTEAIFGGLMLVIFGTGITGVVGRKTARVRD